MGGTVWRAWSQKGLLFLKRLKFTFNGAIYSSSEIEKQDLALKSILWIWLPFPLKTYNPERRESKGPGSYSPAEPLVLPSSSLPHPQPPWCLLSLLSTLFISVPSSASFLPFSGPSEMCLISLQQLRQQSPIIFFLLLQEAWNHFNLFLWALVFNLLPNLISDPSSLRWKKKAWTWLHYLTIPSCLGIKMIRKDSSVWLHYYTLGMLCWEKFFN